MHKTNANLRISNKLLFQLDDPTKFINSEKGRCTCGKLFWRHRTQRNKVTACPKCRGLVEEGRK